MPRIQTEHVDVYLLRPEEERVVELKDFTIMKPKNNKMHRLLRYYPRCEISYRAVPPPPPEEKLVTSPHGTTTTVLAAATHRHNGGFSNPSRNAEVFRLKRQLLEEYFASMGEQTEGQYPGEVIAGLLPRFGGGGFDMGPRPEPIKFYTPETYAYDNNRFRRPPPSPRQRPIRRVPIPKYERVQVGDEETIPLTAERERPLTLDERVEYITNLWPGLAPVDDDEDIMNYYGIEVEIVPEAPENRAENGFAAKVETNQSSSSAPSAPIQQETESAANLSTPAASTTSSTDDSAAPEVPELAVETRSAALQKQKEGEGEKLVKATKQDDWVQCDKCQKWRRLPSELLGVGD